MVISIDTYQRIDLDLSGTGGITQEYSLNNNLSNTNSLYIYLYLNSSDINANIIVTLDEYESNGGSLINTETFTLTNNNKLLNRLNNLTTEYTLISIDYNSYNGQLNGYLEKNIIGDISGNTIIPVDISGQRVDISGQTVIVSGITLDASGLVIDISGQRVDISGQTVIVQGGIDISGQNINDYTLQNISQNINNGIEYSNIKLNSIDNYSSSILNNAILTNTKLAYNTYSSIGQKVDISGQTILSRLYDGSGNNITSTSNALDINIKNQTINRSGTYNNIINNAALNTNSYSTALDVTGFNNSVLSYTDGQNLSDSILIFASLDNTNWFYYGAVIPVYYSILTKRYAATKLNLSQVRYIRIYNSSSTNITSANCTLVSS